MAYMDKESFFSSDKLLELLEALDYTLQYNVCYAFYDEIINGALR